MTDLSQLARRLRSTGGFVPLLTSARFPVVSQQEENPGAVGLLEQTLGTSDVGIYRGLSDAKG